LAKIHEEMEQSGGKSSDENFGAGDLEFGTFWLEEEEGKSDEEGEEQSGCDGMEVGAIESEIGGGAQVAAEGVEVGDGAGGDDGKSDRASDAREGGALQSVGGEGVSEGVHDRSYLTEGDIPSA
jgi:hypothetical protein